MHGMAKTAAWPINPSLEAAVIADAEDDAPRLVYADWLEDNGDPLRAEYIRNECALWDKSPADEDFPGRLERRLELRVQVQRRLPKPRLPSAVGFHDLSLDGRDDASAAYHRGFTYFAKEPSVEGQPGLREAEAFRDALENLVSETTIRGVDFYSLGQYFDTIASSPAAAHLSAVSCGRSNPREDGRTVAELVAASAAAANLVWLDLFEMNTNRELTALASADFRRLRRLETAWWMPEKRVADLLEADWFGRLRRIRCNITRSGGLVARALGQLPELHTIESNEFPNAALGALPKANAFGALGRFSVRASPLRGAGSVALARARMPKLAVLRLEGCGIRNDDVRTLIGSAWFGQLRVLDLPMNEIGDRGVTAIAGSPAAKTLQSLSLGDNTFGKGGLTAIRKPGAFPNLTTLSLHSSLKQKASEEEVTQFLEGLEIPGLRHLELHMWPVSDAGAKAIARNPAFVNLAWLDLGSCQIGNAGLRALAESPHLRKLIYLYLLYNPCEKSVDILCDPALLPNLAECWIPRSGDSMHERLREARPNVLWV
jgi:uncharacterized protein (TIGR02996 family)